MTALNEATRHQLIAADPQKSTWISANAGSGKTRVLTDRVSRLLLDDVDPQQILCLTYTKAAASEMQNRLFKRLGAWAMLEDAQLRDALADLGVGGTLDVERLANARTLFARAIETPGGLKIQTIHSFCAGLLRRFPLEAGVSPNFTEVEDRAAELLRAEIVDAMAEGLNSDAVVSLARFVTDSDFLSLTKEIASMRGGFSQPLNRADLCALFDLAPDMDESRLIAQVFAPGDSQLLDDLIQHLRAGSQTDQKNADALVRLGTFGVSALPFLENVFLTGATAKLPFSAKIGSFPTKATQDAAAYLMPALNALMQRIEDAREDRLALAAIDRTLALHRFSDLFVRQYEAEKNRRGWLDFDDLIARTHALLTDPSVAAWVLYRLDGGIDHILVDEAQDTSPTQWAVIERLAEEFASGVGARADVPRTIFVVGDQKQSIYSFQGADPREFERMRAAFETRLHGAGQELISSTLDYSFRSSPAILRLVDEIFGHRDHSGFGAGSGHIAFRDTLPGRVDLWPVVETDRDSEDRDWFDPVDRRSPLHHTALLADAIAERISGMIGHDLIPMEPDTGGQVTARPVRAGDILILVQKRSGVFPELIRACKSRGLSIAGADRLKVGAEIAVRDLAALLSFLATPEDSLSLATALRSPLFGWSEAELFDLAHNRKGEHLWPALRDLPEQHQKTVSILRDLRDSVDFLRPYDLIERILTRHDGRRRLLARLGPEAEDGIDALLSQARAYEQNSVPSLTGFLVWMETDDLEIKRQIDSASDQIRVMTVHGAKGLEAPIVILPDCGPRPPKVRDTVIDIDGVPAWKPVSAEQPARIRAAVDELKDLERAETLRLLYVATTRAEKWLIVAASGKPGSAGEDWHQIIREGMHKVGAKPLQTPVGDGLRMEYGDWSAMIATNPRVPTAPDISRESWWTESVTDPTPRPETLSPSDLGGAKALPGEGLDEEQAKAYGTLVHELLDRLPHVPEADHRALLAALAPAKLGPDLIESALSEAHSVMSAPDLQALFAAQALSEAPVTADLGPHRLHGTIDRLIITPEAVLAVDFKTNRVVPNAPKECPDGLLRQMGAYAHALAQIYPEKRIETAIVWTRTAQFMTLPHDLVTDALKTVGYLDAPPVPT